jgi:peptidyl-prolyl cis-trans isomerase C
MAGRRGTTGGEYLAIGVLRAVSIALVVGGCGERGSGGGSTGEVVARQGELEVTRAELEAELGPGRRIEEGDPTRATWPPVARTIIRRRRLAQEARLRGLDQQPATRRRLEAVLVSALGDALERELAGSVSVSERELRAPRTPAVAQAFVQAVCLRHPHRKAAMSAAAALRGDRERLARLVKRAQGAAGTDGTERVLPLGSFTARSRALPAAIVKAAFAAEPGSVGGVAAMGEQWCVVLPVRKLDTPGNGAAGMQQRRGLRRRLLRQKLEQRKAALMDALAGDESIELFEPGQDREE